MAHLRQIRLTYWQRESLWAYLFLSPWIIGFVVFTAGAMIASLYLSFTDWDALTPATWVGLANYQKLFFHDPLIWQSLKVTAVYALISVPLNLAIGLLLAILLNQRVPGMRLLRTVYYLPAVIGGVAIAVTWRWMFQGEFGVINLLLREIGIKGPDWLFSRQWVIPSFLIVSLWQVGASMVINLAALQGIPSELYEAAGIDGCTAAGKFRYITLPGMSAVLFFNLVIGIISSFRIFTQAYVLTGGGPGNASLFYNLYLFKNAFRFFKMGYASAMAWVLLLIILILTAAVFKSSPYWVFYETELRKGEKTK